MSNNSTDVFILCDTSIYLIVLLYIMTFGVHTNLHIYVNHPFAMLYIHKYIYT